MTGAAGFALVKMGVSRFGALDVMVNNAGIAAEGSALEVTLEDRTQTIATDLSGVFHGCRAALPELLKTRGCTIEHGRMVSRRRYELALARSRGRARRGRSRRVVST